MQYWPTRRTRSALASARGAVSADSSWSAGNCPFVAPDSTTGMWARSASRRSASQARLWKTPLLETMIGRSASLSRATARSMARGSGWGRVSVRYFDLSK